MGESAFPSFFFMFCLPVSEIGKETHVARKSPTEKLKWLLQVTGAWERVRPHRSFFGYTLARFKAAIQPSLDARAEIEDLKQRLRIAIRRRNEADRQSYRILRGVVFAVQGDPAEGGNGELYVAMGYVPWWGRGRPRKRGKRSERGRR